MSFAGFTLEGHSASFKKCMHSQIFLQFAQLLELGVLLLAVWKHFHQQHWTTSTDPCLCQISYGVLHTCCQILQNLRELGHDSHVFLSGTKFFYQRNGNGSTPREEMWQKEFSGSASLQIIQLETHDARASTTLCTTKDGLVQSVTRLTHFLHPDGSDGEMLQKDGGRVVVIEWEITDRLHTCMIYDREFMCSFFSVGHQMPVKEWALHCDLLKSDD